jgi:hypothetical protein
MVVNSKANFYYYPHPTDGAAVRLPPNNSGHPSALARQDFYYYPHP